MEKKLRPYMLCDRHGGSQEGAVLVFANNAREAKKVGWSMGELMDICDNEWINIEVLWLKKSPHIFEEADQEKLEKGIPHLANPRMCLSCELWGHEMATDDLCIGCKEEQEQK